MGSKVIADVAARFEAAVSDRGMNRAGHVAASTRIRDLITAALLDVRRLDLMVSNELASDNVINALWQQARRVGKPARFTVQAEAAVATDAPPAVEPPPAIVPPAVVAPPTAVVPPAAVASPTAVVPPAVVVPPTAVESAGAPARDPAPAEQAA